MASEDRSKLSSSAGKSQLYKDFGSVDDTIESIAQYPSYRDCKYSSELMMSLVSLDSPDNEITPQQRQQMNRLLSYKAKDILPEWLLQNQDWQILKGQTLANEVSDILKIPFPERTSEQGMILIEWMMSVWPVAAQMGMKRVASMMKEFTYASYEPGENIVTEGEHGLSFFVIISGVVEVVKNGVGKLILS